MKDQRKDDAEESIFDDNLGRDDNVNSPTFQYGKYSDGFYLQELKNRMLSIVLSQEGNEI